MDVGTINHVDHGREIRDNVEIAYITKTHKIIFSANVTHALYQIDPSLHNEYIEGMIKRGDLIVRGLPKAKNSERNLPCICGSKKKRKKCCK